MTFEVAATQNKISQSQISDINSSFTKHRRLMCISAAFPGSKVSNPISSSSSRREHALEPTSKQCAGGRDRAAIELDEIFEVVVEVCSPKTHFLYCSSTISLHIFGL